MNDVPLDVAFEDKQDNEIRPRLQGWGLSVLLTLLIFYLIHGVIGYYWLDLPHSADITMLLFAMMLNHYAYYIDGNLIFGIRYKWVTFAYLLFSLIFFTVRFFDII